MAKRRRRNKAKPGIPMVSVFSRRGKKVNPKTRVSMPLGTLKRMLAAARRGVGAKANVRSR
jgi:hypothetical protein